jgi:Ca-activated chloride channel family protein
MPELLWPWVFVLAPLPWVVWRWWPPARPVRALHMPHPGLHFDRVGDASMSRLPAILLALAWLCLLAAVAQPQWLGPPQPLTRSGRALMLAVDISGSMALDDMQLGGSDVSRFVAVEAIVGDFISRRAGDRVGLILFGSQAYLVTPLTFDLDAVRAQLEGAAVGLAGRETAIGDAIAVAVKRLRPLPAKARVLVLLTDGVNTAGNLDPRAAAGIAKAAGVRIYTIGIGADRMRVDGFFGTQTINPSADLDAAMLTSIAESTGGRFFRATDSTQLADAYRSIDALEPLAHDAPPLRPRRELYPWPLAAALLLALQATGLRRPRRQRAATGAAAWQRPVFAHRTGGGATVREGGSP